MPGVTCIGELLWDIFPDGKKLLGGAPANVTYHLRELGIDARLVTRVGADESGQSAATELQRFAIPLTDLQIDPALPTGSASVNPDGQAAVGYEFVTPAAWDAIEVPTPSSREIVVFGTMAQRDLRSRSTIRSLAAHAGLRVYDVNLRFPYTALETVVESFGLSTIVKMNEDEACTIARFLDLAIEPRQFARTLMARYGPTVVCVTRGKQGAWLTTADGIWAEVQGSSVSSIDPVGAGDAFLAALVAGRIREASWQDTLQEANRLGAWVTSQRGAMSPHTGCRLGL